MTMQLKVVTINCKENEEFKEKLESLCDEDYNGNNGEEYFIDINGTLISQFDAIWNDLINKGYTYEYVIENILNDNYNNSYYTKYKLEITKINHYIVVSLAYSYSN